MVELDWKHHALIQTLLSRGPLKEEEFHSIFKGITGNIPGGNQHLFNEYLGKINKELAFVQFELRACRNQYDGEVYYGVVNNVADEQSKLGTKYSVPQIAYYKAVVEAIVQDVAVQGSISFIDALNIRLKNQIQGSQCGQSQLSSAFTNFSMSKKEITLDDLVRDRWLSSFPNGKIGLGVRSFLDLRSWFRKNEIPSCDVCNEAGIKAELCCNKACMARMHNYCLKKKFSHGRVAKVCPSCGTVWPDAEFSMKEEDLKPEVPTPSQVHIVNAVIWKKPRSCMTRRSRYIMKEEDLEPKVNQVPIVSPVIWKKARSCRTRRSRYC